VRRTLYIIQPYLDGIRKTSSVKTST